VKIIIVGAGIGGLSAGIALRKFGHQVEIYEAVQSIQPVGAAISLWSNGIKCLNYLGLNREIARIGGDMAFMAYLDAISGEQITRFSLEPLVTRVGERPYPVSRTDLQEMLMQAFGLTDIALGKRLVRIHDNGQFVTAYFEDGTEAKADILIGADGTHSRVRDHVLGFAVERKYAGYVNWNGLVAVDEAVAPPNQWTMFVGESKRVSLMPVAGKRFYFFFDVPLPKGLREDRSTVRTDLRRYFQGWAGPVQTLIENLDPASTNRVEIHDIEPIEQFCRGRVALLGDAAHSMTPDIGQGGCMALEDAVMLAMTLQTHSLGVEDALYRYQERRRQRANELVMKARTRSDTTHGKDPTATYRWYESLKATNGDRIIRGLAETISRGPFQ